MTDTQHNTDKNRSSHHHPDVNADGERETFTHQSHHDTHIIALVAMAIIVLAVVYVAFTFEGDRQSEQVGADKPTYTSPANPGRSSGIFVAREQVAMASTSDTSALPSGAIFSNAEIASNYTTDLGSGRTQQIANLSFSQPKAAVLENYEDWLAESELTDIREEERGESTAITADFGESEFTMLIVPTTSSTTSVQLQLISGN